MHCGECGGKSGGSRSSSLCGDDGGMEDWKKALSRLSVQGRDPTPSRGGALLSCYGQATHASCHFHISASLVFIVLLTVFQPDPLLPA